MTCLCIGEENSHAHGLKFSSEAVYDEMIELMKWFSRGGVHPVVKFLFGLVLLERYSKSQAVVSLFFVVVLSFIG